jgi:hypothetical protein
MELYVSYIYVWRCSFCILIQLNQREFEPKLFSKLILINFKIGRSHDRQAKHITYRRLS